MSTESKKRGLGRGLDALFKDARAEEQAYAVKQRRADEMVAAAQKIQSNGAAAPRRLPVEQLTPGAYQPRRVFRDDALAQLAESIAVHGVLQPLLVRPVGEGRYEIIAGERRWRAAQKAQAHDVPVVIRQMTDTEALEIGLIENLQREDLTALEEAQGYQRLIDEFGHTQEQLAKQLGRSRSHIANTLRLLKLPEGVKALVQSGDLSAGHARTLVGVADAQNLAALIVKKGLSVRQAEDLARKAQDGKPVATGKKPVFKQKDVDVLALEEKMTMLLGLKTTIACKAGSKTQSGSITIAYTTLDQLDDILARLSRVPA